MFLEAMYRKMSLQFWGTFISVIMRKQH